MADDDILVDPARLIRVTYTTPEDPAIEVLALACHYVVASNPDGKRAIGIEVIFDPTIQPPQTLPTEAYYCPTSRLERPLIAPKDLKKVSPIHAEVHKP